MLGNDPQALAGYNRYKLATGKTSVFEVLDALRGREFESLTTFFAEYELKATLKSEAQSPPANTSTAPLKEGQFTANPPENIPHTTHKNAPAITGEEPHIVGKAKTAEGHTIKVNREGEIGTCSICEIIRKEFASELEKHPEIKQELDQVYLIPDPQVKAEKAAEIQSRLSAIRKAAVTVQDEFWKEEQIVYTAGNPEYIQLTMIDDPLQVFTLRRDEGGDWYVIKRSEAARLKNKLMDTEIVARVPERYRRKKLVPYIGFGTTASGSKVRAYKIENIDIAEATIDTDGIIWLDVQLPKELQKQGYLESIMSDSIDFFTKNGRSVNGVRGAWLRGAQYENKISDNLRVFIENYIDKDMSFEQAALNTPTGKVAQKFEFRRVIKVDMMYDELNYSTGKPKHIYRVYVNFVK